MRTAWISSGVVGDAQMTACTAPPFCARPVMSSTVAPLPSRCAAMPISAPIVTTPVPPMPVTRMPYGCVERRQTSAAGKVGSVSRSWRPRRFFGAAAVRP